MIYLVVFSRVTLELKELLGEEVAVLKSKMVIPCTTYDVLLDGAWHSIQLSEYLTFCAKVMPMPLVCNYTRIEVNLHVKKGIFFEERVYKPYLPGYECLYPSYRKDVHCVWVARTGFAKNRRELFGSENLAVSNPPPPSETLDLQVGFFLLRPRAFEWK